MEEEPEHNLLLRWLILTGLICFSLIVAENENVIDALFRVDKSRISWVIALIYLLVTIHCARRIYILSTQMNLSLRVDAIIKNETKLSLKLDNTTVLVNDSETLPDCFMTEYIRDLFLRQREMKGDSEVIASSNLTDVYESRLKGPQEIGWFVSDMLLKLGLLGTIIGFIFMLDSVSTIADFDVSTMQKILRQMSNGMGTALYTTLAGLVCSILSAIQYYMLDKHADKLIELIQHLMQVHVIPKINREIKV